MPDAPLSAIEARAKDREGIDGLRQEGTSVVMKLTAGDYAFSYEPTVPYRRVFSIISQREPSP